MAYYPLIKIIVVNGTAALQLFTRRKTEFMSQKCTIQLISKKNKTIDILT
jgi:hypothetical protein